MSLRERLLALAADWTYRRDPEQGLLEGNHKLALAAARMALEDAKRACEDEEIYPDERWGGIYNVAVKSCSAAIRTLRDSLADV